MSDRPEPAPEKVYLHDVPLARAWDRFRAALAAVGLWQALEAEEVALDRALGRITAEPVWARVSSPHYHAAAMDGYALRAQTSEEPATVPRSRSRSILKLSMWIPETRCRIGRMPWCPSKRWSR